MNPAHRASKVFEWAFLLGVLALPLQWFPQIGFGAAQLSDLLFLLAAIAFVFSSTRLIRLPGPDLAWVGVFVCGITISALVNGGSYLKLLGHYELVAVMLMAATLAQDTSVAERLRHALIGAAIVGALTGLSGAVLFYLGEQSGLLNHYGDLVPGNYPRIRGTCVRANMLATVLATGLILVRAEGAKSPVYRWRTAITLLLGCALFFTFSRTWLTVAAGLLALHALQVGSARLRLAAAAATVLTVALLIISARYTIHIDPTRFWQATVSTDPASRWVIWQGALNTIASNPIWGLGPGAAASNNWSAHLVWLNLWAVLGLAPLCAFAMGCYRAMRLYRYDLGAAVVLGVMLLDGFARDIEDMRHLWVVLGLLLATSCVRGEK